MKINRMIRIPYKIKNKTKKIILNKVVNKKILNKIMKKKIK